MSSRRSFSYTRRWRTLTVLSIAQLMVLLDATVINIALPRAQTALHFSVGNRQWVITAYALAFGSLLLLGGRLSDLWGRRNALYIGLAGFALASALGGSAHSFTMLVVARAIQGVFGALLAPAALAALSITFTDAKERAKAFAIYGVIGGSGAAVGLLLGGALTQWASWRWCLYINLVFAAVAIVGVAIYVGGGRDEHHTRLDVLGTLLASVGLFFVVFGLSHAVTASWSNEVTWGSLAIGALLLVAFVGWQHRSTHPMLPLRVVAQRTRAGALISLLLTSMGIFAAFLFLAYYLEANLGYSPLRTGVAFLPLVVAISLSASVASARLLAKIGPRPLVPTGMVLSTMGMILFTRITSVSQYWGDVLPGLVVLGLGLGLIFAPAVETATSGVERRDAGAASAIVNTTQQIGGSIGTALLNTIAVTVASRDLSHATPFGRPSYLAVHAEAAIHGYAVAFWWSAGFFGLGAIVTFLMLESGVAHREDAPEDLAQMSGQGYGGQSEASSGIG